MNPNTGDLLPLRRWPIDRYRELVRRLLDTHPDVAVLVTGSPSEARDAEAFAASVGDARCASVAGRTTLRELLVLYHQAEVLVTNDSGPVHYAALTPVEVVALFGPETPVVFGPLSPGAQALTSSVPCSPCVNALNDRTTACRDNVCLQRISVDEVEVAVTRALARGSGA